MNSGIKSKLEIIIFDISVKLESFSPGNVVPKWLINIKSRFVFIPALKWFGNGALFMVFTKFCAVVSSSSPASIRNSVLTAGLLKVSFAVNVFWAFPENKRIIPLLLAPPIPVYLIKQNFLLFKTSDKSNL